MSHCNFFVKHKGRFCRMAVIRGSNFCGEHMEIKSEPEEAADMERIRCPFDNKHTVYKKNLLSHLAKCNARKREPVPYIVDGMNKVCGITEDQLKEEKILTLAEISDEALMCLIEKIRAVGRVIPEVQSDIIVHPVLAEKLVAEDYGPIARKHLLQNASLLGHIDKLGFIKDYTCFVEFGAGRGQLGYWLSKAVHSKKGCMVLLVDYASVRHKFENKLKDEEDRPVICRMRADIADLCMNKVDIGNCKHIVGIAKHLCGAAGDMALNCLTAEGVVDKLDGIVMSFCCHHRSTWLSYTGKDFLLEKGFFPEEFGLLCGVASWATSGYARRLDNDPNVLEQQGRYARMELDQNTREEIGEMCKSMLDIGRLQFLEGKGFPAKLVFYVDRNVTPECRCTLATKST